jgi:hypothetical protein
MNGIGGIDGMPDGAGEMGIAVVIAADASSNCRQAWRYASRCWL